MKQKRKRKWKSKISNDKQEKNREFVTRVTLLC